MTKKAMASFFSCGIALALGCGPAHQESRPQRAPQGYRPGQLDGPGSAPGEKVKQGYVPERYGDRLVTYVETGGIALIEGDIQVVPSSLKPSPTAVAIRGNQLWPGAIIPFEASLSLESLVKLDKAMEEWESKTPIRFVRRNAAVHGDYVSFQRYAVPTAGNSALGRTGGKQVIYLGEDLSPGGIAHEIGHAVGLEHEHNSPERDAFVQIFLDNVEDGKESNFDLADDTLVLRPYDYQSIMHYKANSFGKKDAMGNRAITMARRDGSTMLGFGQTLTVEDVRGVEALYGPFAFVSQFAGGDPLGGKSCFPMGPGKDGAFQSKTGGSRFCVASPSWLWSNVGTSDSRLAALPAGSYRCLEIAASRDADFSKERNYLCYPAATPMILSWSDAGPLTGFRCVMPYLRGAGSAFNSANLCYFNGTVGVLGELPRNRENGGCLDLDGASRAVTSSCAGRRWKMTEIEPGRTTQLLLDPADYLGARSGATCLGTAADVPLSGDAVLGQTCDSAKRSQRWTLGSDGELRNGGPTGLCLRNNLGTVTVAVCTGSDAMKWIIRRQAGPVVPRCDGGLTHAEACGDPPLCGTVVDRCGTEFPCGPPCPDPPGEPTCPDGVCPPLPPSCGPPNELCCDGICARVCGVCSP